MQKQEEKQEEKKEEKKKEKQLNQKIQTPPKALKELINTIINLKKEEENTKKKMNIKVGNKQEIQEEQGKLTEISTILEELMIQFSQMIASAITNLKSENDKCFFRFGSNLLCKDNQLKEIIKEIAIGQGIQHTLRGQNNDLIVYTEDDQENDFDFNQKQERNEGHPRKKPKIPEEVKPEEKEQEKEKEKDPKEKDKDPIKQLLYELPPDDIKEIIVNADISQQESIAIRFNKPDDNGNAIDKYQICLILDNSIDNLQLNPQQQLIAEIYQTTYGICHNLQFKKKIQKSSSNIPYNQFLTLSVQAHNKYGWSNNFQQQYINLYCQYKTGSSLFLIGLNSHINIQPYLEQVQQPIIYEDQLIVNRVSLVLIEPGTVKQVCSKFGSTIIVNLNFQACQWGKIVNFEDQSKTESFEVNPQDFDMAMPYQIDTVKAISKVSCGFYHSLATTVDGQVLAWGLNNFGQLGNGTTQSRFSPYQLSYFTNQEIYVIDVQAADCISMCRTIKGEVYCWGKQQNVYGNQCFKVINRFKETINLQCFDPTNSQTQPRKIVNLEAKQIAIGNQCFAAISKDDSVYMWGNNDKQVFGFKNCEDLEDQQINHLMDPIKLQIKGSEIQLGGYHCIVKIDKGTHDEFISWGWNQYGQCGQKKSEIETYGKILTLPQTKYNQFSCGYNHSLFLTQDNKVYGLGNNQFGQICNNLNIVDSDKPLQLDTGTIKIDNICCGENISYILGD